jgi:uncharacterized membrane protein YhaH (DUF805 family)
VTWTQLFTSFEGRIARQSFWLGVVVLLAAAIALSFLAGLAFGIGPVEAYRMQLVTLVLLAYPATALVVKRLNDRDRPRGLVALFWGPSILILIGQGTGLAGTMSDVYGTPVFKPNMLGMGLYALAIATGLWALIELGILRGTNGPNRHGPDPLA